MEKNWTGERLETYIYSRDTIDHLHRYAIAKDYIKGKSVLDIASGEGYGSNLLSYDAASVVGVDIDAESVKNATNKYKRSNLEFKVGRADLIPLDSNSIDVVVSFETLEHHDKHQEMILEIKRVLKKDGLLIISTPDKLFYSDKRNFKNEFHVQELYKNEFQDLISQNFLNYQCLNQKYILGSSLIQEDNNIQIEEIFVGDYSVLNKIEIDPLYLIMICSDGNFLKQKTSIFNGNQITEKELVSAFRKSYSFKLGSFILSPLKFIKKCLQ